MAPLLLAAMLTLPTANDRDVTLVWSDTEQALPWGSRDVAREVVAIFERLGVRVVWEDDGAHRRPAAPEERRLLVILRPASSSRYGLPENTMGVVLGDEPHTAVFVFFRNVAATLGFEAPYDRREQNDLNRALARVVAHEVIHAVLGDGRHDGRGLLSLRLDKKRLLRARLEPTKRTQYALRARLGRLPAAGGHRR